MAQLQENNMNKYSSLNNLANAIRFLSIDMVEKANSGHPGLPMGMADVVTVLYKNFLKFCPKNPKWANRDRFVLSAGHGSALLYSLLYLTGYEDVTLEDLKRFRQLHSSAAGHPEYGEALGIETTTGPLGQGIATAVGMALGERMLSHRIGKEHIDYHTYVLASDGDLMEGISHEAASLAGHLQLNKLIVLFDDNGITIDGKTDLTTSDDQLLRFQSYGWHTQAIDGHNYEQIHQSISQAKKSEKSSLIACKTTIGYGSPNKAGTSNCHGSPLGREEVEATRKALNWTSPPFVIPPEILNEWRNIGEQNNSIFKEWNSKSFEIVDKFLTQELNLNIEKLVKDLQINNPKLATRQLSQKVLEYIISDIPNLVGGSADLTGSNNTKTAFHKNITPQDFSGNYINYGIREHAMAAVMNGLSLSGFIPYGGTFLVFSDYLKPALRLSALMKQRVIYVFTHDSIGLGEDGPTHQPIEHLASLRAIPNLLVFRPCDGIEVAEAWSLSLQCVDKPSAIILTRQSLTTVRLEKYKENLSSKGGYILSPSKNAKRQVTIIATGSEVEIALASQEKLENLGIGATVVSMPCWQLFDMQSKKYKQSVLGEGLRIGIEAASEFGWHKYIGENGIFIGMNSFGASAPAQDLYNHFSLTSKNVVSLVQSFQDEL